MAISNVALLAKENQDLRASHEKYLQKRKRSSRQIICTEGFSVQETQNLIQHGNEVQEVQNAGFMESVSVTSYHSVRASIT
jgi:hypothetical protein